MNCPYLKLQRSEMLGVVDSQQWLAPTSFTETEVRHFLLLSFPQRISSRVSFAQNIAFLASFVYDFNFPCKLYYKECLTVSCNLRSRFQSMWTYIIRGYRYQPICELQYQKNPISVHHCCLYTYTFFLRCQIQYAQNECVCIHIFALICFCEVCVVCVYCMQ